MAATAPPPLATTLTTATGTWAVIPVGARSGQGRFWELLWRGAGSTRWSLVTPPGVQDNGGLTIASTATGTLDAGFLPSFNLRFSPLAITSDHGASWTPQLLPDALADSPDALATNAHGATYALSPLRGGEILVQSRPGASWALLASARTLGRTSAARDCGLESLDALTLSRSGQLIVGGRCAQAGQIGEYADSRGRWGRVAQRLPAALRHDAMRVARLTSTPDATFTLLEATAPRGVILLAAWSIGAEAHWQQARPLRLAPGQRLLSSGPGPGRLAYAVTEAPRGPITLWANDGPGSGWRTRPAPPSGTATVASAVNATVDALTAHGTTITDWRLQPGGRHWRQRQTIHVVFTTP